jgi:hypothetical protein
MTQQIKNPQDHHRVKFQIIFKMNFFLTEIFFQVPFF